MTEEQFTAWSMRICLSVLVLFLGFIVYDLGKQSKAGKFGMFVLFFVLGLGVFGFIFKEFLISFLTGMK